MTRAMAAVVANCMYDGRLGAAASGTWPIRTTFQLIKCVLWERLQTSWQEGQSVLMNPAVAQLKEFQGRECSGR